MLLPAPLKAQKSEHTWRDPALKLLQLFNHMAKIPPTTYTEKASYDLGILQARSSVIIEVIGGSTLLLVSNQFHY